MLHITCPNCGERFPEPKGSRAECPACGVSLKFNPEEPPLYVNLEWLKVLAFAFFLIGLIAVIGFAMMDSTVQTEFGRVYNLHAASTKQTGLILSGLACAAGLVTLAILASRKD